MNEEIKVEENEEIETEVEEVEEKLGTKIWRGVKRYGKKIAIAAVIGTVGFLIGRKMSDKGEYTSDDNLIEGDASESENIGDSSSDEQTTEE